MRILRRRFWKLVSAGIFSVLAVSDERVICAGPPKEDQPRPAPSRPVDLAPGLVRACKGGTALVDLQARGSGTAACVSTDGFFVTNHHVVADLGLGKSVKLVLHPGQETERVLMARVIKLDPQNDLALLKVPASPDLIAVPLGTEDELAETMSLTAFGYPFGRMLALEGEYPSVSVNTGAITALRRKDGRLSMIQLDAAVNPGNSGGPVVDNKGRLIGIIVSGLPGAQINFAIPVGRVLDLLATPALVLRNPRVKFIDRAKVHRFEVDAYALDRKSLDGLRVELTLAADADDTRTLQTMQTVDQFVAEGLIYPSAIAPSRSVLVVYKGRGRILGEVPVGQLTFGKRQFSWAEVDSLVKDGGEWIVSLWNGDRFAGRPSGLTGIRWGKGRTTELATADRIEIRLDREPLTKVKYEINATQGQHTFDAISGEIRIEDVPPSLTPRLDLPVSRSRVEQPIVIEAVVPSTLTLQATPLGLNLSGPRAKPAGMNDQRGRYILVNGQPWHLDRVDNILPQTPNGVTISRLPIILGGRDSQFRLLWARAEGDGPHDGSLAALDIRTINGAGTVAMIKNLAPQPTRVAVAVTFDPPTPIYPLQPPRIEPVLESHWRLNDTDPDHAIDIGPAKRDGRTSVAQSIPGVRGDGIRIDRQAILCPGVLPVERTDPFSCSAWIKPRPTEGLTIFSRMDRNLRGFDLSYVGTLQAHLISSWDGNAIRVNSVERLDTSSWHHVALTYDGSSRARGLKVYLDGAPTTVEITGDRLSETIHNEVPFAIGSRERSEYFQGQIDEVRAYDRELSADEIFELYDLERSNLDPSSSTSLTQGLVGYWPFDGPSAERYRDRSGLGHDGHLEVDKGGPEVVASDGGQALRLDAMEAINFGVIADFDRTDPYSLGFWFRARGEGYRTILGTLDQTDRGYEIGFDGHLRCRLISQWDGCAIEIATRPDLAGGVWHHAVVTFDGSSKSSGFRVYVDGTETPFNVSHDSLTSSTKNRGVLRLGGRMGKDFFAGELDDVFVYRRVISFEEAKGWFNLERKQHLPLAEDRRRGLIALWTFEGNGQEVLIDRSGNGHDGRPDNVHATHSLIKAQGPTRVARFGELGGIDCGQAGDFERNEAFSVGGWFLWEGGSTCSLLSKMLHGGPNRGYDIQFDGERYTVQLTNNWSYGPQNAICIQSDPIAGTASVWRHVFFTYDGSSRGAGLKFYINGELKKMNVLADNLTKSIRVEEPFVIGSRFTAATLRGRASNIRAIPRALTAHDVRELAKADRPAGLQP